MNFRKKLFARHLFFFLALPIFCNSQNNFSHPQSKNPNPIVVKIANLPTGYYSGLDEIVASYENKLIFTGRNSIWVFDGVNWESRALTGKPVFAKKDGKIIIAYNNRIEEHELVNHDKIRITVIIDSTDLKDIGGISTIISSSEQLYFTTPKGLWVLSEKLEKVDSTDLWIHLLGDEQAIFYAKAKYGIFKIISQGDGPKLIPNTLEYVNSNLVQVFEFAETNLAITRNAPWIIPLDSSNKNTFSQLVSILKFLNAVIKNAYIFNSKLYILTESNGILVIGKDGEIIQHLRIESPSGEVQALSILPVSKDVLLVLTPTSIVSATSTNISGIYSNSCGIATPPSGIIYSNGYLYCSTRENTFGSKYILGHPYSIQFNNIQGIGESTLYLYEFNYQLFGIGKDGIYRIDGLSSTKISRKIPIPNSGLMSFAELNSRLWLITSCDTSLTAYSATDSSNEWFTIPFPIHNQQIESLHFYDGHLFSLSSNGKWFVGKLASSFEGWREIVLPKSLQGTFSISSFNQRKPYIITQTNLFTYDYANNSIGKNLVYDTSGYISPLFVDSSILLAKRFNKSFPHLFSIGIYENSSQEKPLTFSKPIANLPISEIISGALSLPDSSIFLSTSSGIYYFTKIEDTLNKPKVSIFRISLESDKELFALKDGYFTGDEDNSNGVNISSNRSLKIIFASIGSELWNLGLNSTQYSSFIEGHDNEWSLWTVSNVRDVNRIKAGHYTLKVKAKNFYGEESDITSFSFVIKPQFFEIPYFIIAMFVLGLLGTIVFFQWRRYSHAKVRYKLESLINQRTEELVKEKEKTDNLLARVLPKDTASELKEKGRVSTQRFQMVTVLFCDIEGFTRITEETFPELLIDQLDKFFLYFDSVVEKYKIEKIKTIGDAYMCAGGIPKKNQTNPVEVVLAALEMMYYMRDITEKSSGSHNVWELRIGIDTGPVIAGVVGRNKLSYDIWGSTVNTASRMESSGQAGQINISGNTFTLVKEYFLCTFRGYMPVKNKGDIQMYFVQGIRPNLSEGTLGVVPNQEFKILLQLIRLNDLEEFILDKLEKGLPKNLYYHNLKHTVDVFTQVELIGRAENVSKEELLLLKTAALFHDAGHLIDYDTHEEMAVKLVREILPEYQYSDRQIEMISQLIMCTKLPPNPKSILEEIMCDADLDYLGRPDFIPVSNTLYKELHEHGKVGTLREWNELQIKFIDKHSYFTKTARRLRNVNKQSQLDKLKTWLEKN